jgi:hypothetical protein
MGLGLLVAAGMFLYEARVIVNDGMRDDEAFAVLGAANTVLHNLENAETGQRGYLLTGDESYLLLYRQGAEDLDDTVLRLQRVVSNDEKSVELVRRIEHAKTDKVAELARTIQLAALVTGPPPSHSCRPTKAGGTWRAFARTLAGCWMTGGKNAGSQRMTRTSGWCTARLRWRSLLFSCVV